MSESITPIAWSQGQWTHPPAAISELGGELQVTAIEGSDAWRITSYGFIHDSEHALLVPLPNESGMEVSFLAGFSEQFDQAGLFLRAAPDHWIKAGTEFADGVLQLGAVVTNPLSDWSVAQVPDWSGRLVTVRLSRSGDAVTVRARVDNEPFRLVRLIPLAPELLMEAGPLIAAPTRSGLTVLFRDWVRTEPDAALH